MWAIRATMPCMPWCRLNTSPLVTSEAAASGTKQSATSPRQGCQHNTSQLLPLPYSITLPPFAVIYQNKKSLLKTGIWPAPRSLAAFTGTKKKRDRSTICGVLLQIEALMTVIFLTTSIQIIQFTAELFFCKACVFLECRDKTTSIYISLQVYRDNQLSNKPQ